MFRPSSPSPPLFTPLHPSPPPLHPWTQLVGADDNDDGDMTYLLWRCRRFPLVILWVKKVCCKPLFETLFYIPNSIPNEGGGGWHTGMMAGCSFPASASTYGESYTILSIAPPISYEFPRTNPRCSNVSHTPPTT